MPDHPRLFFWIVHFCFSSTGAAKILLPCAHNISRGLALFFLNFNFHKGGKLTHKIKSLVYRCRGNVSAPVPDVHEAMLDGRLDELLGHLLLLLVAGG